MVKLTCTYCHNTFEHYPLGLIGSLFNIALGGSSEEKVRCPHCKMIITQK